MTKDKPIEIVIGGKKIDYHPINLDILKLKYYLENPRVQHIISGIKSPTQEQIEKELWGLNSTKDLYQDIKLNQGVIDPVIVKDNVVLEGNSRLCACRKLYENATTKEEKDKWRWILTIQLPSDVTEKQIFQLLGTYHIRGKAAWRTFEKAGYVYKMNNQFQMTTEEIAKDLGLSKAEIERMLDSYITMKNENVKDIEKFSYFIEFNKSREFKKEREINPKIVKDFANWVKEDKIPRADAVRDLPKILSDKKAKALFKDGGKFSSCKEIAFSNNPEHESSFLKLLKRVTKELSKAKILKLRNELKDQAKLTIVKKFLTEVKSFESNLKL